MTKFSLEILDVLISNRATVSMKSLSIPQIREKMLSKKKKSYSTIYRHLLRLTKQGYVKNALDDGLASTYIITDTGKRLHDTLYK